MAKFKDLLGQEIVPGKIAMATHGSRGGVMGIVSKLNPQTVSMIGKAGQQIAVPPGEMILIDEQLVAAKKQSTIDWFKTTYADRISDITVVPTVKVAIRYIVLYIPACDPDNLHVIRVEGDSNNLVVSTFNAYKDALPNGKSTYHHQIIDKHFIEKGDKQLKPKYTSSIYYAGARNVVLALRSVPDCIKGHSFFDPNGNSLIPIADTDYIK